MESEIDVLEQQSFQTDFWNDNENASKVMQKLSGLRSEINQINGLTLKVKHALFGPRIRFEHRSRSSDMMIAIKLTYEQIQLVTK